MPPETSPRHPNPARTPSDPPWARWTIASLIALATVYFVADDSARVRELEAQIQELSKKSTVARAQRAPFRLAQSPGERPSFQSLSPNAPPDEFLARIGITAEELRETDEITARGEKGEYILKMERPLTRRFLDYDFRQLVAADASRLAERYAPVFAELGVSPEKAKQLKTHLGKLQRASLELTLAQQQDEEARQAYDREMRTTLSEEDYARYRQFEDSTHARREVERIQIFARENGLPEITAEDRDRLAEAIQEHEAYMAKIANGPYDPVPPSIIGTANVLREIEMQQRNILEQSTRVQRSLAENGLPAGPSAMLRRYYDREIARRDRIMEQVRRRQAQAVRSEAMDVGGLMDSLKQR